ncbi:dTMP kinase [Hyphomonas sp.]|uniref:dTMP kinase n=1 Tax=Hyphomonas sp. TaxID=87 RepID=UPI003918FA32
MTDGARGRFITLEGGEGTGKSTLARALAARLEALGLTVLVTREPGGTPLAEAARGLLLHPPGEDTWAPLSEALLVNAARQDHVARRIRPALEAGHWVICDRFADSTRVYQGLAGSVPMALLRAIETEVLGGTVPDLTLVLDAPLDVTLARRVDRGGAQDTFEARGEAFHTAVREAFLQVAAAEPERCAVIDAALAPEQVLEAAWPRISALLPAVDAGRVPP